jgi:hypothetical protein
VARPSPVQMWWEGAQGTCVKRLAQGRSRVRANVMSAFDLLFSLPAGLFPGGPVGSQAKRRKGHSSAAKAFAHALWPAEDSRLSAHR